MLVAHKAKDQPWELWVRSSPCAGYPGEVLDVKVISVEGSANHDSPESCVAAGNRKVDRERCRSGIEP